jgi:hypothetical protein
MRNAADHVDALVERAFEVLCRVLTTVTRL